MILQRESNLSAAALLSLASCSLLFFLTAATAVATPPQQTAPTSDAVESSEAPPEEDSPFTAPPDLTAAQVEQLVMSVGGRIAALRHHKRIDYIPRTVPYSGERTPINVYFKVRDLLHQVALLQQQSGISSQQPQLTPLPSVAEAINGFDSWEVLMQIRQGLDEIAEAWGVPMPTIEPLEPITASPTTVYYRLASLDVQLDGLIHRSLFNPNYHWRNGAILLRQLSEIAAHEEVVLRDLPLSATTSPHSTLEVQQLARNNHHFLRMIEEFLSIVPPDPLRQPAWSSDGELGDITQLMFVEGIRIQMVLGIENRPSLPHLPKNKEVTDLWKQQQQIRHWLLQLKDHFEQR